MHVQSCQISATPPVKSDLAKRHQFQSSHGMALSVPQLRPLEEQRLIIPLAAPLRLAAPQVHPTQQVQLLVPGRILPSSGYSQRDE